MPAKVNRSVTLHEVNLFEIVTENITLENGVTTDVNILRHPGASAIIPLTDQNTVIMVKQYRHALGSFIWEIPAGTLGYKEKPEMCAKRELIEETGFSANTWQKLGEITPVPGYSDERVHIFLATDLTPAEQNLDRDELLEVHEVPFDHALEMAYTGKIQDGKTISGLFMLKHHLDAG